MELKTKVSTGTSVKSKIFVGVLMVWAIGAGAFLAMPILNQNYINSNINDDFVIFLRPFLIKDVVNTIATSNWSSTWTTLYAADNSNFFFGNVPYTDSAHAPGLYLDGQAATTNKALEIGYWAPHASRVLAIVDNTNTTRTLCIPADTAAVSARHYYFDFRGNAYADKDLKTIALTNCVLYNSKSFFPRSITAAQISEAYPSFHVNVGIRKDSKLLAYYNTEHAFTLTGEQGILNSKASLSVKIDATDETFTLPERTVNLTTNIGTKTICIPQLSIAPGMVQVEYFYDNNGNPYSDALLTQRVSGSCL